MRELLLSLQIETLYEKFRENVNFHVIICNMLQLASYVYDMRLAVEVGAMHYSRE